MHFTKFLSRRYAAMAIVVLASTACGGESDSATGDTSDAGTDSAQCADLSYETFGQAFLSSYCVSCHGPTTQQKGVRLDSLASLTAVASKSSVEVSRGDMPPKGATAPSASERAMFVRWVQCGAD